MLSLNKLIIAFGIVTVFFLSLIFYRIFPVCYIEGEGLTLFKILSEFVIIGILILGIYLLFKNKEYFDRRIYQLLMIAIISTIIAEFSFTAYVSVYEFSNFIGHLAKLISFYLIYRAIIVTSLYQPYDLVFRDLKLSQESLKKEKAILERLNMELNQNKKKITELNKSIQMVNSILRHDLYNDLNNINLTLELYGIEPDEKSIQIIRNALNKGIDLIKSMKNLESLIVKGENLKNISIDEILAEVLFKYRDETIKITITGDKGLTIRGDEAFQSILDNLLRNAVLHSGTDKIVINLMKKSQKNIIQVMDFGTGIPAELKERIFQPGFTRDKTRSSLGLGLFIVKNIVERYGGKVYVKDNQPSGTIFILEFPIYT